MNLTQNVLKRGLFSYQNAKNHAYLGNNVDDADDIRLHPAGFRT